MFIVDDSAIIFDEVIDSNADGDAEAKSKEETKLCDKTTFNEKIATCKTHNFYILPAFLLITIALLIAVSIYFYLIKYRTKQLLPLHYTNINKCIYKCIMKMSNKVKDIYIHIYIYYRYIKPHILLFQLYDQYKKF